MAILVMEERRRSKASMGTSTKPPDNISMMSPEDCERVLAAFQDHASKFAAIAERRNRTAEPEQETGSERRLSLVPPVPNDCEPTARELQVLTLIADGHDNNTIGGRLFIAEDTVKSHVRGLLQKLGARNRAHAVAVGCRRGLIGAEIPLEPPLYGI
jgi:DNA-binding NarL/FixJ family response regulator